MKLLVWGLLLLCIPAVFAQEGSIKLLALSERADGSESGAVADLDLRIEPGNHRVFLETFPLTKITTQISMRFAQQVACKELNIDCSDKDFFFTIRALPGIVGGPSAGSAAAVLAASLITDTPLRNDTVITGTINSGGVIGPVGGLPQKIEAAANAGMKRALIPLGTRELAENATNKSLDLVVYGKQLGIEVIEVGTLTEALEYYTGKTFPRVTGELVIEQSYQDTMRDIAVDLCNRTAVIKALLDDKRNITANTTEHERNAANMTRRAQDSFSAGQYYASASYCFRSNVLLKRALALQRPWTQHQLAKALIELKARMLNYSNIIDAHDINTIADLQSYMAVKERLFDVEDSFFEIAKNLPDNESNAERLAYAEERLFSAAAWARFFNGNDKKYVIDDRSLRESCMAKISEAEERYNYVKSVIPESLEDARRELDKAYQDLTSGNYTLCLYKASKTKAEADVILNVMGVEKRNVDKLIDLKLGIVKEALIKSQQKGIFPIIGYSYYEYASSLRDLDTYSTLLFAEYALEFSNLDLYFARRKPLPGFWETVQPHLGWIGVGIILGIFAAIMIDTLRPEERQKRRRIK